MQAGVRSGPATEARPETRTPGCEGRARAPPQHGCRPGLECRPLRSSTNWRAAANRYGYALAGELPVVKRIETSLEIPKFQLLPVAPRALFAKNPKMNYTTRVFSPPAREVSYKVSHYVHPRVGKRGPFNQARSAQPPLTPMRPTTPTAVRDRFKNPTKKDIFKFFAGQRIKNFVAPLSAPSAGATSCLFLAYDVVVSPDAEEEDGFDFITHQEAEEAGAAVPAHGPAAGAEADPAMMVQRIGGMFKEVVGRVMDSIRQVEPFFASASAGLRSDAEEETASLEDSDAIFRDVGEGDEGFSQMLAGLARYLAVPRGVPNKQQLRALLLTAVKNFLLAVDEGRTDSAEVKSAVAFAQLLQDDEDEDGMVIINAEAEADMPAEEADGLEACPFPSMSDFGVLSLAHLHDVKVLHLAATSVVGAKHCIDIGWEAQALQRLVSPHCLQHEFCPSWLRLNMLAGGMHLKFRPDVVHWSAHSFTHPEGKVPAVSKHLGRALDPRMSASHHRDVLLRIAGPGKILMALFCNSYDFGMRCVAGDDGFAYAVVTKSKIDDRLCQPFTEGFYRMESAWPERPELAFAYARRRAYRYGFADADPELQHAEGTRRRRVAGGQVHFIAKERVRDDVPPKPWVVVVRHSFVCHPHHLDERRQMVAAVRAICALTLRELELISAPSAEFAIDRSTEGVVISCPAHFGAIFLDLFRNHARVPTGCHAAVSVAGSAFALEVIGEPGLECQDIMDALVATGDWAAKLDPANFSAASQ